jgi:hypothetical protein
MEIDCYEFSAGIRGFNEDDQKLFLEACAAAKSGSEFKQTITSPTINPRTSETTFESTQINGAWRVRVTRGKEVAVFSPQEGDRLQSALEDAKAGAAWFESLLSDEALPEPSEERHPPHSNGYYLVSNIGKVDAGGFTYEVALRCDPYGGETEYRTGHTIAFGKNDQRLGSMGGEWVKSLLQQVSAALEALKSGSEYDFVPEDRKFRVHLNHETREADVTIAKSDFFPNRDPIVGHIGEAQFQRINTLLAEVPGREKWFREHESLFFSRPSETQ